MNTFAVRLLSFITDCSFSLSIKNITACVVLHLHHLTIQANVLKTENSGLNSTRETREVLQMHFDNSRQAKCLTVLRELGYKLYCQVVSRAH